MFGWLKRGSGETKPGKKLALINLRDYPSSAYRAYFEIGVRESANGDWTWVARILSYTAVHTEEGYPDPFLLETSRGTAPSEHEARRQSQTWVKAMMETFRRVDEGGLA